MEHSIITIATNKQSYYKFAIACARSVLLSNNIPFYIVTNLDVKVPRDLRGKVILLEAEKDQAKLGIGIKLFIDKYVQTEKTLFIDSDCICYSSLQPIFEAFKGKSVSVVGNVVDARLFCGSKQAKTIKDNFNIDKLVKFNGGVYYIERSEKSTKIFDDARQIIPKYDSFGFNRINNKWINEEGLISISMIMNGETPIPDDGRYMTDLFTDPKSSRLNPLTGERILNNPNKNKLKHRPWYPIGDYSPIIIHFGGSSLTSYPYISQYY
ncbi:MAG: hypothetical protein EOO93_08665, partial [Pedobacter sp.]